MQEKKTQNLSSMMNVSTFEKEDYHSATNDTQYMFDDDSVDLFKDESHDINMTLDWGDVHKWLSKNNSDNHSLESCKEYESFLINTRHSSRGKYDASLTNSILDLSAISYFDDTLYDSDDNDDNTDIAVSSEHVVNDAGTSKVPKQEQVTTVAEDIYYATFGWAFSPPDKNDQKLGRKKTPKKLKNLYDKHDKDSSPPPLLNASTTSSVADTSFFSTCSLFEISEEATFHDALPSPHEKDDSVLSMFSRCLCI